LSFNLPDDAIVKGSGFGDDGFEYFVAYEPCLPGNKWLQEEK
jgi:hypothetical protein